MTDLSKRRLKTWIRLLGVTLSSLESSDLPTPRQLTLGL